MINDIQMNVINETDNTITHIDIPATLLEPLTTRMITGMVSPVGNGTEESKNLARLIRTAVKGLFMMYGDKILTMLVGKDHAKPGKKDDVLEWYTQTFAMLLLQFAASQSYTIFTDVKDNSVGNIQIVREFVTVPVSVAK
jgi:hypothetical protein